MQRTATDTLLRTVGRLLRLHDPVITRHPDLAALPALLTEVEAATHHRLWNVQRYYQLSQNRLTWELDRRSRARCIEERSVVGRRGAAGFPLLTTIEPTLRIGPVLHPLLVADSTFTLLTIPDSTTEESPTISTTDPDLVALAVAAFLEIWDQGVTWEEAGLLPPLPERRLRVAVQLIDGLSDREIADELGVSERTVSAEVRAVVDWLGARNRTHAVAMLVGAA